jgi:hypothetical protein
LAAFLDAHPDTALVGCRMYNSRECSGLHRTYYNKYPTIPNSFLHQLATFLKLPARLPEAAITRKMQIGMAISLHDREQEAEHINGACMVCRTEVLRQVGGSDGRFPLFLEETDLCMRVREAGWKIRYTPRAEIIHLGSQSLILLGKSKEFHYASKVFLEKHYGKLHAALYKMEVKLLERIAPLLLNQEYKF